MDREIFLIKWCLSKDDWKSLPLKDKIRAKLLFKVIFPASKLIILDEKEQE